jgi:hypothetical protein
VSSLEPNYLARALAALDALEGGADDKLLNAVCDVIDLICDHRGDRRARAEQLRTAAGTPVRKVPVRTSADDWVVLWWPRGAVADTCYIGSM